MGVIKGDASLEYGSLVFWHMTYENAVAGVRVGLIVRAWIVAHMFLHLAFRPRTLNPKPLNPDPLPVDPKSFSLKLEKFFSQEPQAAQLSRTVIRFIYF